MTTIKNLEEIKMVCIINKDDFIENAKRIITASDYLLFNGTDSSKVANYGGADRVSCLQPKHSLLKNYSESRNTENDLKKWLKDDAMTEYIAMAAASIIKENDQNVYFILENKVYKLFAKYLRNRILKLYGIEKDNNDVVVLFDDLDGMKDIALGDIKHKIKKIDKKIDNYPTDGSRKKLHELREKREELCGDTDMSKKRIIKQCLTAGTNISADSLRSMKRFLNKYKDTYDFIKK